MGEFGSGGRTSRRRTVDSTFQLNIARLKECGSLTPGAVGRLTWSMRDLETASMGYIVLRFRYSENGSTNWQNIERRIYLKSTPCHFGGSRKWFVCRDCASRMGTLSIHLNQFLCRHCLGLPYLSQNSSNYDRQIQKVHKLRARIGSETRKPKGMHWSIYRRLTGRYINAKEAATLRLYDLVKKRELLLDEYRGSWSDRAHTFGVGV
jgi:hypothetical protein